MPEAHFVAVFAKVAADCNLEYRPACLAISSAEDETTEGADDHIAFLIFVLELF